MAMSNTAIDARAAIRHEHQAATEHHPEQDRQRGAGFHQTIAANQFTRLQCLRQDRVLDWPEHRGVHAHQEQHHQQQCRVMCVEAPGRDRHRHDLEEFHEANQPRLLIFLGELSGQRREQEERQDEQCRCQIGVQPLLRQVQPQLRGDQYNGRVAEHVVIERAQALHHEKRQEAALAQQSELTRS
jgi:hypothetical protein